MKLSTYLKQIAFGGLFLGMIAVTQPGCLVVAAAAGAGAGVAYYKGDLDATLDATPDQVARASEAALEDLNIRLISTNASGVDGTVIGRTAGDDKVAIKIKSESEKTSKVSIRIGTFGDQAMSNRILAKINERLAAK